MLKDTDAVIFLTNASRPLTQGERELLQDLKTQLNHGKQNEPANNLFVVSNFIDLVRSEKSREQVRQKLEKLVLGQNRVHLISAQAALDAISHGNESEYLTSFENFIQSLEQFITLEIGREKIHHYGIQINRVVQECLNSLSQYESTLDKKNIFFDSEKQGILEKIGEASGRDIRIGILASKIVDEVYEEATKSLSKWYEGLRKRMDDKSPAWNSKHNPIFSQDQLIKDYTNHFITDLSIEIDEWENKTLKDIILKKAVNYLDIHIADEIDAIQRDFQQLDQQLTTNISEKLNLSMTSINGDFTGLGGMSGGLRIGGALAIGLIFTGLGLAVGISNAGTMVSSIRSGMAYIDKLYNQIKLKVLDIGFERFDNSIDENLAKLEEIINTVLNRQIKSASRVIEHAIALYETLLEQQEKAHQETLEQHEAEKKLIDQKRQKLEQVKNDLKILLDQV